jgi:hypothetical protein
MSFFLLQLRIGSVFFFSVALQLVQHVPKMMRLCPLATWSCQAVEGNNALLQRWYNRCSFKQRGTSGMRGLHQKVLRRLALPVIDKYLDYDSDISD